MNRSCALIALVTVLAACGGDSGESLPTSTQPAEQTPVILPSPSPTVVSQLSAVDIKQALITRTDLRQVWYDSQDDLPDLKPSDTCAPPTTFDAVDSAAAASTTFSMSNRGPWVTEKLLLYSDPETATEAFDALRAGFECSEWTPAASPDQAPERQATGEAEEPTTSATSTTATATPMTIVWTASAPSELDMRGGAFLAGLASETDDSIEVEYIAVRENNLLLLVTHWSPFTIDTDVTMSFIDLALERLDAAFN